MKINKIILVIVSLMITSCKPLTSVEPTIEPVVEYQNILEVKEAFKEASANHEIPNELLCFIGKYRDVYVLSYNGEISAIPEKIWNSGYLTQNLDNQYYALYNGKLYTLDSLFHIGLLVREDFTDIQNKIYDLPLYKVESDFEFVNINEDIEVCLHEYTYKTIKEASCLEKGERQVVCKKCDFLRERMDISVKLHEYNNGLCVNCADKEKSSIGENEEALEMIQNDKEFKWYEQVEFIKGFKTYDNELYVYYLNNYLGKETIETGYLFGGSSQSIHSYGDARLVVVDSKNEDVIDISSASYRNILNKNDIESLIDLFVNNKEFNEKIYNVRQEMVMNKPHLKNYPFHESCYDNINYNLKSYYKIIKYIDEFDDLVQDNTKGRAYYFLGKVEDGYVVSYVKDNRGWFIDYQNYTDFLYEVGGVQITGQLGFIGFVYNKGNKMLSLEEAYKQKMISKKGLLTIKDRFEERFNKTN